MIAVKSLPRATGNSADSIARDEACRPIAPLKSQGCDVRRFLGRKSHGMCVREGERERERGRERERERERERGRERERERERD